MDEATAGRVYGIDLFLEEILVALRGGLSQLALMGALTIPDIMAALASESGTTDGDNYKKWFDENARENIDGGTADYPRRIAPELEELLGELPDAVHGFTGEMCWLFRCAVLHQARSGHPKGLTRIVFVEPGTTNMHLHMNSFSDGAGNTVLNMDLQVFCKGLVQAASDWLDRNISDPVVQRNLVEVVRRYPDGNKYISGVPVIM